MGLIRFSTRGCVCKNDKTLVFVVFCYPVCARREEIKAWWSLMEKFFNLSEEIVQRSEFKRSGKLFICSQNRRSVDWPVNRPAQEQFGRPSGRLTAEPISVKGRSTDWHEPFFCWASIDRRKESAVRRKESVARQSHLLVLSGFELRFWPGVEFNCGFIKLQDFLVINKGVEPIGVGSISNSFIVAQFCVWLFGYGAVFFEHGAVMLWVWYSTRKL